MRLAKALFVHPREPWNDAIMLMGFVAGGQSNLATLERNGVRLLFTNTGRELVAKATPI